MLTAAQRHAELQGIRPARGYEYTVARHEWRKALMLENTPIPLPFDPVMVDTFNAGSIHQLFGKAVDAYRSRREFKNADRLRDWLAWLGYDVRQSKTGTEVSSYSDADALWRLA